MSETSIDFAGARVDAHGRIIYDPNHPESAKAFLEAFREEEFGKEFEPYWTREAGARVMEVIDEKFPNQPITLAMLGSITHLLIITHDPAVNPSAPEEEDTPVDDRPRDAQGRFLSEYEGWSITPDRSMAEVRARAKSDPKGFGAWYADQMARQGIPGAYRVIAGTQPVIPDQSTDLRSFVDCLNKMPSCERKLVGGFYHIDGRRYTKAQFDNEVQLAIAAGLL